MDEELRAYLDAMREEFARGQEQVLNRIVALEQAIAALEQEFRSAQRRPKREGETS